MVVLARISTRHRRRAFSRRCSAASYGRIVRSSRISWRVDRKNWGAVIFELFVAGHDFLAQCAVRPRIILGRRIFQADMDGVPRRWVAGATALDRAGRFIGLLALHTHSRPDPLGGRVVRVSSSGISTTRDWAPLGGPIQTVGGLLAAKEHKLVVLGPALLRVTAFAVHDYRAGCQFLAKRPQAPAWATKRHGPHSAGWRAIRSSGPTAIVSHYAKFSGVWTTARNGGMGHMQAPSSPMRRER